MMEHLERRHLLAADMLGVVRNGHDWLLNTNLDAAHEIDIGFGLPGDVLYASGDWNGNGRQNPAAVRKHANGGLQWLLDANGDAQPEQSFFFGLHSHIPITGDFNGDGKADVAAIGPDSVIDPVVKLPTLKWYISFAPFQTDSNGFLAVEQTRTAGFLGDRPVVGDWDGDGDDDTGVVSQQPTSEGLQRWYLHTNNSIVTVDYGFFGDRPVVGDWDGDGDDDVGIVTADANRDGKQDSLLTWFLDTNRDKWPEITRTYGLPGDVPVVGQWKFPEVSVLFNNQPIYTGHQVHLGDVRLGTSVSRLFDSRNDGTVNINYSLPNFSSSEQQQGFKISNGIASPKAPGQRSDFGFTFTADALGSKQATLLLYSDDHNENPFRILISANVVDPEIQVDYQGHNITDGQQSVIDFGRITQGLVGPSRSFTVRNTGGAPLKILSAAVPNGFVVTQALPSTIPQNSQAVLTVQLKSTSVGLFQGHIQINNDDRDEGQFDFPISGRVLSKPVSREHLGVFRAQTPLASWLLDLDSDQEHEVDLNYGFSSDAPLVGDWDGDGHHNPATVRKHPNGGLQWLLDSNGDAHAEQLFFFGLHSHIPITGDFNGDGRTDVAAIGPDSVIDPVVKLPTLKWYISFAPFQTDNNGFLAVEETRTAGFLGDRPVVGDWDGGGDDDTGVVSQQPTSEGLQRWYLHTNNSIVTVDYGFFGDRPVVGDWDGDGDDDVGVVTADANRDGLPESLLTWFLDTNRDKWPEITRLYGFPSDTPVVGRWAFPEVTVDGIASGQTSAVNFGTGNKGQTLQRTFTIRNDGNRDLLLGNLTVTGGFQVGADTLKSVLGAGQSDTFVIAVKDTLLLGAVTGSVTFTTNDPNEAVFTFPVKANVVGPDVWIYPDARPHLPIRDGQTGRVQLGTFNQDVVSQHRFVVENRGNRNLQLSDLRVSTGFEVIELLSATLGSGQLTTFTIAMPTDELGLIRGSVTFATNDAAVGDFTFPVEGRVEFNPLTSEFGVFRNGLWLLDTNRDPAHELFWNFGLPGDVAVVGDWNGDGVQNVGVVRPGTDGLLHWYLSLDEDPWPETEIRFGLIGDTPVVGNWDGKGGDNVGVVTADGNRDGRPDSKLTWFLDLDGDPDPEQTVVFGTPGDRPVVGDFDGDGRDDLAVASPNATCQGEYPHLLSWCVDTNRDGVPEPSYFQQFGFLTDMPIVGDWDGDGYADVGAVRDNPADDDPLLTWYLDVTGDPHVDFTFQYGLPGDTPVVGRWLPGNRRATIQGYKWHDLDGDGFFDPDEPGLPGQTVYLDLNRNGIWDANEIATITQADDPNTPSNESGRFEFSNLRPGTYFVKTIQEQGFLAVFPRPEGHYTSGQVAAADRSERMAAVQTVLSQLEASASEQHVYPHPQTSLSTQPAQNPLAQIRVDAFRKTPQYRSIDGTGRAIVVIDTGLDVNHQLFGPDANRDGISDRITYQFDFADNNSRADDRNGHGSHVTSLAAGGGTSLFGVAPAADIIHLKIFPDDSSTTNELLLEKAIKWVIEHTAIYNIVAVNLSLAAGNKLRLPLEPHALRDEFEALAQLDVILVAATGNAFDPAQPGVAFPAADPDVIAVGAVSSSSQLASFSQRAAGMTDVLAPGVLIRGADRDGGTTVYSGTSQAAPYVAGAAVLAQHLAETHLGRRLTVPEFRAALEASETRIADPVLRGANGQPLTYPLLDMQAIAAFVTSLPATDVHHAQKIRVGPTDQVRILFGDLQAAGLPQPASEIRGMVFRDLNGNGLRDPGEAGIAGRSLYLDYNDNARWDAGEPQTLTGSDGTYRFQALGADVYAVRLVYESGSTTTTRGDLDLARSSTAQFALSGDVQPSNSLVVDLNADGRNDLVVTEASSNSLAIWLRRSDGTFPPQPTRIWLGDLRQPKQVVAGQFDDDVFPELAVINFQSGSVSILDNQGPGPNGTVRLAVVQEIKVGSQPMAAAVCQLAGDVRQDLAVVNRHSGSITILENEGSSGFSVAATIPVGDNPQAIACADFDRDGRPDLAVAVKNEDRLAVLLSQGDASFTQRSVATGDGPTAVVAHDFDGDNKPDLAVANRLGNTVQVFRNTGNGQFVLTQTLPVGSEPLSLALGDFDEQGGLDLVTTNVASGDLSILRAEQDGRFHQPLAFRTAFVYGTQIAESRVTAGDLLDDAGAELIVTLPKDNSVLVLCPNLVSGLRRVALTSLNDIVTGQDFGSAPFRTSWQNPVNRYDVDNNGSTQPLDVLMLVNHVNLHAGNPMLPSWPTLPTHYLDVNDDGAVTAQDVLMVIGFLNAGGTHSGEAEGELSRRPYWNPDWQTPTVLPEWNGAHEKNASMPAGRIPEETRGTTTRDFGISVRSDTARPALLEDDRFDLLLATLAQARNPHRTRLELDSELLSIEAALDGFAEDLMSITK
jgi:hypothetical protein